MDFQSFGLAMQDSYPSLYQDSHSSSHPSVALKPGIICTFLIHSASLQKFLTALFNLVWNTQKSVNGQCFFECQGKIFLSIEKVLEIIKEDQPLMHCLIVFLHIFEIKVSTFLLSYNLRNVIKQNWHWIHLKTLKQWYNTL